MNYLNKLEELISKESVTKESNTKVNKTKINSKNEKFFTEEEINILTKLHITKKEKKLIENVKDVFGKSSRVIKGYKINFNNSRKPIEKITGEKVANRKKEHKQISLFEEKG